MKEIVDETSDWQEVPNVELPSQEFEGVSVFVHRNHSQPNTPASGSRITYGKERVRFIRATVVRGEHNPELVPPNGFQTSAQYGAQYALDTISMHRNVPEGIKTVAREFHPKDIRGQTHQVSVAAAVVDVEPTGISAELFRAGIARFYVFEKDSGWHEVLGGSIYSPNGIEKLQELQREFERERQKAAEQYGPTSKEVKRVFIKHQRQVSVHNSTFKRHDCPPLGRFWGSGRLQKVKNVRFSDLDAVLVSTRHPELTKDVLNSHGDPIKLSHDFFREIHGGKSEFSASAIMLNR